MGMMVHVILLPKLLLPKFHYPENCLPDSAYDETSIVKGACIKPLRLAIVEIEGTKYYHDEKCHSKCVHYRLLSFIQSPTIANSTKGPARSRSRDDQIIDVANPRQPIAAEVIVQIAQMLLQLIERLTFHPYSYNLDGTGSLNSKFANDVCVSSGASRISVLMSLCTSSGS